MLLMHSCRQSARYGKAALQHSQCQSDRLKGGIFGGVKRLGAGLLGMWIIGISLPVLAADWPEPTQGSLLYESPDGGWQIGLPVSTKVRMQVSGLINRVHVEQTFYNPGDTWLQGRYLFPLPDMSAVDGMELRIGERLIQGQIREKQQAKNEFAKAQAQGKRASLVEQHRPNIFSTQVANLGPGETLTVAISYLQTLEYQDGRFSLRFPMLVAPRYQAGGGNEETFAPLHDESIQAAYLMPVEQAATQGSASGVYEETQEAKEFTGLAVAPGTVDIHVSVANAGQLGEIVSPHHWVTVTPSVYGSAQVELLGAVPDRDFLLEWPLADNSRPGAFSFMQSGMSYPSEDPQIKAAEQEKEYGLVMLVPPAMDKWRYQGRRDLTLVIDTSGSMGGESIKQAKSALLKALGTLNPQDSFNIIAFSSDLKLFASGSIPANKGNLALARDFVGRLHADGGTNMAPALMQAMLGNTPSSVKRYGESQAGESRLGQIIFITDGAVGNERELFALISHNLQNKRLFTVGIGAAPNSFFMERAARSGRGTFTYIASGQEVESKMSALLEKIASPVLTNLTLRYEDGTVPEYWPATLPDLYAGEPVLVSLRQTANRNHTLVVSGEQGSLDEHDTLAGGQYWQQSLSLQTALSSDAGLDLLWAREQIAERNLGKTPATAERVKEQVTALALKYHLVSPYTSLVAVDMTPARPVDADTRLAQAGLMMPAGWRPTPTGIMPQTATGSLGELSIGALLAVLGLTGYWLTVRTTARAPQHSRKS